ncbi:MAG: hypothetical protein U9R48_10040 [Chloroflexota bacterium]|nr:hypothetical protein [Chloroflexota bacterium]
MSSSRSSPGRIRLQIISPEKIVYEEEVDWLQVPLSDGLLGIWPGHAPLIASLTQGQIQFGVDGSVEEIAVGEGILRVDGERCIVLTGAPVSEGEASGADAGALGDDPRDGLQEVPTGGEFEELQRG